VLLSNQNEIFQLLAGAPLIFHLDQGDKSYAVTIQTSVIPLNYFPNNWIRPLIIDGDILDIVTMLLNKKHQLHKHTTQSIYTPLNSFSTSTNTQTTHNT
jgi:hypothetical protein